MIQISLWYLGIIHLFIVLYCIEVIDSLSLIITLYILNVLPVLTILQQEYIPNLINIFDGNDFYIIRQVQQPLDRQETFESFHDLSLKEPSYLQVKLFDNIGKPSRAVIQPYSFIKRWRENVLNRPKQFPLDRLAYLKAKYYTCEYYYDFTIENSHLKELVRKGDYRPYEDYEDDPHPMKMVKNLASNYIHNRAYQYTARKTTIVDKRKQTTAHRIKKFSMSTILKTLSFIKNDRDSDENVKPVVKRSISMYVEEESTSSTSSTSSEEATTSRKPSMWRRISSAFTRRSSKAPSTDDEYTDY